MQAFLFEANRKKQNRPTSPGWSELNSDDFVGNVTVTTSSLCRHSMADSLRKKAEAIKQKAISSVSHVISVLYNFWHNVWHILNLLNN